MSGSTKEEADKNYEVKKIAKNIAKEVIIEK